MLPPQVRSAPDLFTAMAATGTTQEPRAPAKSESPRVGLGLGKLASSQVISLCSEVKKRGFGVDPQTDWGVSGKNTRSVAPTKEMSFRRSR